MATATGYVGKSQRSSSICLSASQTFDAMRTSVGNRDSSSGSDSPEIRYRPEPAAAVSTGYNNRIPPPPSSAASLRTRQQARRSKSERVQGANKPRVKRRGDGTSGASGGQQSGMVDLNRANSGSVSGGLAGPNGGGGGRGGNDQQDDFYYFQQQSGLRKVPSVGAALMNDSFGDTPDGSPRLRPVSSRPGGRLPPSLATANMAPAISSPELSPSLIRRATVNSAGVRSNRPTTAQTSTASSGGSSIGGGGGSQSVSATRGSPVIRTKEYSPSSSLSHKRTASVRASSRRSTYLDVPEPPSNCNDDDKNLLANPPDEDSYRLRSFDLTRKGVVNRGDSFRRRRSRSNSLAPGQHDSTGDVSGGKSRTQQLHQPPLQQQQPTAIQQSSPAPASDRLCPAPAPGVVKTYRVAVIGAHGVGKSALIAQFMTSDCINAYDRVRNEDDDSESVYVMLNGEESELVFTYVTNIKVEMNRNELPDAYVVVYSVIDKSSFQRIEDEMARLQNWEALRARALIVVGNKIDLVRSRAVSTQDGKCLACAYRAKFMEVSVVINHNVDELLVGILTQIRLKEELQREMADHNMTSHGHHQAASSADSSSGQQQGSWIRNKGLVRASMKAKQMFTWLFGKDDDQFANCENFQVL